MNRYDLLKELPAYRDEWVMTKENHSVKDIMRQVLESHDEFAEYYDKISGYFETNDIEALCDSLYQFCKDNITYQEEAEDDQTTALPAGILTRGHGDCKHYAGFCGGILDSLKRKGYKIKWNYRFASYRPFDRTVHHVFIVVHNNGQEIYIDPTPGAYKLTPTYLIDKKISGMPLYKNIGSISQADIDNGNVNYDVLGISMDDLYKELPQLAAKGGEEQLTIVQESEIDLDNAQLNATLLLMENGIIDLKGNIYPGRIALITDANKKTEVQQAYNFANSDNSVAGIFGWLWFGVKSVHWLVQRNAYLALTSLNVFGNATKLYSVLNGTPEEKKKMRDIWVDTFGGNFSRLESAIRTGYRSKRILGFDNNKIGLTPEVWAAIIAAAASIIMAAMSALIKKRDSGNEINPATGLPWGYQLPVSNSTGVMRWITENPLLAAGIGFVVVNYAVLDKNERII